MKSTGVLGQREHISKDHEQVGDEVFARASPLSRNHDPWTIPKNRLLTFPAKLGFGGPVTLRRCLMFGWRRLGIWASFVDATLKKTGYLLERDPSRRESGGYNRITS